MLELVVIIVLILFLAGGGWGWRSGYYGGGVFGGTLGAIFLVVVLWLLLGR